MTTQNDTVTAEPTGKSKGERNALKWLTATAVGVFSGFSGLAADTHLRFRHKLIDSIAKTNVDKVHGEIETLNTTLSNHEEVLTRLRSQNLLTDLSGEQKTRVEGMFEQAEKKAETLKADIKSLEKRIELKDLYDQHAVNLDKNFMDRIKESFVPKADQAKATEKYLTNGSQIKTDFQKEIRNFSKECLGTESEGLGRYLKGTAQRFRYMGENTKFSIGMNAGIATAVGAAGTLMFFNSLNTHHKLDALVEEKNQHTKG